jgi:hypothetical protein
MKFFVNLQPAVWKVGNASHFINIERRLKQQVPFLRALRDKEVIESGPFAVLNAAAASAAFIINTNSWESLSRTLHEDPMAIYQNPVIHYLADWEEAMAKHAETVGSEHGVESLQGDVRTDLGLDLPRPRDAVQTLIYEQGKQIELLRAEVATLTKHLEEIAVGKKK